MKVHTEELKMESHGNLFSKIDSLSGVEKEKFCKTLTKEQKKAYVDYIKEKDTEMITGVFKCFEPVGGSVTFSAQPYEGYSFKYTMEHGKEYTVPACVARHLEIGCWYPTHSHIMDANGSPIVGVGKKNFRFSFNTGSIR